MNSNNDCRHEFGDLEAAYKKKYNLDVCLDSNKTNRNYGSYFPMMEGEKHIPGNRVFLIFLILGMNFCGPGTKVAERLSKGVKGTCLLDNGCMQHDIDYSLHDNDDKALMDSDRRLIKVALMAKREVENRLAANRPSVVNWLMEKFSIPKDLSDAVLQREDEIEKIGTEAVAGVFKAKSFAEGSGLWKPSEFVGNLGKTSDFDKKLILKKFNERFNV